MRMSRRGIINTANMGPIIIAANEIRRCLHTANGYGSESYTWSDVTNDANTTLYRYDYTDNALYDNHGFLQFRIPASSLSGLGIETVKFYMRAISANRTIPLLLIASNTADIENMGGYYIREDSISDAGWSDTDITYLFDNNLTNKDAVWYIQVRIGYISKDLTYEAYINTLNGDYDPYVEIIRS